MYQQLFVKNDNSVNLVQTHPVSASNQTNDTELDLNKQHESLYICLHVQIKSKSADTYHSNPLTYQIYSTYFQTSCPLPIQTC